MRGAALPMGFNRTPLYTRGVLLVGDFGGMVSPFNGEGIAYAMQAGRAAADVVAQSRARLTDGGRERALQTYPRLMRRELGGYYTLGRYFVKLIEHPEIMRICTRYGSAPGRHAVRPQAPVGLLRAPRRRLGRPRDRRADQGGAIVMSPRGQGRHPRTAQRRHSHHLTADPDDVVRGDPPRAPLEESTMTNPYVPLLVLMGVAAVLALGGVAASAVIGPKRYNRAKLDAYECGIEPTPHAVGGGRFPIKYYLVAMTFIVFDIEVVFLYPWAVDFATLATFGLVAMLAFLALITVPFVYEWRRGASSGTDGGTQRGPRRAPARELGETPWGSRKLPRASCSPRSRTSRGTCARRRCGP